MEKANFKIVESTFEEIYPFWDLELWPGRKSAIEPLSLINENGEIDRTLTMSPVFFWKAVESNKIIGVIGAQVTTDTIRCRGLWVSPQARNVGIGSALIKRAIDQGIKGKSARVWTMCRQTVWPVYEKNGFTIVKEISKYEFGPHYLVQRSLKV